MSVPISNVSRRVVLAASGTGPYSFNFEILANTDIAVYKDDTLLTLTTDYTVTINSNGTGYVTLTASPAGASQIAIVGDRTIQRTSDFTTGGDLFATTLNDELDSQTIFAQQNAEAVARAIVAPQTDPTTINMVLPKKDDRKGKLLVFNETTGNPEAGATISQINTVANNIDEIVAVGTKVINYLPVTGGSGTVSIDTSLAGTFQLTLTGNVTTLTFANPPASGIVGGFTLVVIQDSSPRTIAWPASVKWPYGAAPVLSTASGAIDIFSFFTYNSGTTWFGFPSAKGMA